MLIMLTFEKLFSAQQDRSLFCLVETIHLTVTLPAIPNQGLSGCSIVLLMSPHVLCGCKGWGGGLFHGSLTMPL